MKIGGPSGRVRIAGSSRSASARIRQRREHPLEVPTRREAPERRQRRLLTEAGREGAKRLDEARVGERLGVETRALCRVGDQRLWREPRFVAGKKRAGKPVHSPGYHGAT